MSDTIKFGSVSIDARDYASQGNAILGIRDSGKSYTATFIAERLMDAGIPIVAFDPIGLWRFLRVAGSKPGYPVVVAGGEHGDLPLTPSAAPELIRAAMREGVSLVLDLYSMNLSKADWKRIVQQSVSVLLYENKKHGLRHIFVEEAAEFAPQRVGPDQGHVYAEIEKLARMGGNALLGYTLINQRAEEVNKAVLELCDGLFLHRQKGRNSLTALSKWLDIADASGGKEIIKSLPTLPQGECWVWPAGTDRPVHVKIPEKRTFHPDRRAMRDGIAAVPQKTVNVSAFVEQMKGSLEKIVAEAKANDPAELKREIARLQREAAGKSNAPSAQELSEAENRGYARGKIEGYADALKLAEPFLPKLRQISAIGTDLAQGIEAWSQRKPQPAPSYRPVASVTPPSPRAHVSNGNGSSEVGSGGLRRILTALAQCPDGLSTRQIGVRANLSSKSGTFDTYLSKARSNGWITGERSRLQITNAGMAALGDYEPLPAGRELLDHWLAELGASGASRLLRAAADAYPRSLTRQELADAAGLAMSGTFDTYLSKLRTLELIEGRGELKASDDLFS